MSSRIRTPERDLELDWQEPARPRPRPGGRGKRPARRSPGRRFGPPVVVAALAVGLLVGWVANSGGGGTTTVTQTRTVTAPAAAGAVASGAASRGEISLAVLNGSGEDGLAARTAEEARAMGYAQVTEGNAPEPAAADRVLHRPGAAAKARQVAQDLGLPAPTAIAADDPVSTAAGPDDDVIVVLGPPGASDGDGAAGGTVMSPQDVAPPAGTGEPTG